MTATGLSTTRLIGHQGVGISPGIAYHAARYLEQVHLVLHDLRELHRFFQLQPARDQIRRAEAILYREILATTLFDRSDYSLREASAVLDAAAVFVGAEVRSRRDELSQQPAMPAVDHHHVETGLLGTERGRSVVLDDLVHHLQGHFFHLDLTTAPVLSELADRAGGADGVPSTVQLADGHPAGVLQLDGGYCAAALDGLGQVGQARDDTFVAQVDLPGLIDGAVLVDGALAHRDDGSPTFGLSTVELDQFSGHRLVGVCEPHHRGGYFDTVLGGETPDLDGFEYDFPICHLHASSS
jgi:hypothetical protein